MPEKLLSDGQVRLVRTAVALVMGLLVLGVTVALLTYPSWQLGLALALVLVAAVAAVLLPSRMLAPLQQGVPASAYLPSAGLALLVVALVVGAGLLFSQAPIS